MPARRFQGFLISGGTVYGHTGRAVHGRPTGDRVRLGHVRKVSGGWVNSDGSTKYKRQSDAAKALYRRHN